MKKNIKGEKLYILEDDYHNKRKLTLKEIIHEADNISDVKSYWVYFGKSKMDVFNLKYLKETCFELLKKIDAE